MVICVHNNIASHERMIVVFMITAITEHHSFLTSHAGNESSKCKLLLLFPYKVFWAGRPFHLHQLKGYYEVWDQEVV